MGNIKTLLPVILLAGVFAFAADSVVPSEAQACYQNYSSSHWCYEPLLCNASQPKTEMLGGSSYATYTSYWVSCTNCPSTSFESFYGIDPCLPD